jgi:hypothetical protein
MLTTAPSSLAGMGRAPLHKHILGLNHGFISLHILGWGDTVDQSRPEIQKEIIMAHDENWIGPVIKQYTYVSECPEVKERFLLWYRANMGYVIRIIAPKRIEYGVLLHDGLQIKNNIRNGHDISFNIYSTLELLQRNITN